MGGPWRYDDENRRFAPLDADRKVLQEAMGSTGAGVIESPYATHLFFTIRR
ncbi:MAG TPA: hypothetical protein VHO07_23250 [Streptosporangiaceae bacterium]|jgi:hypothetical protein|nr:hypothetical protein [Streptosporangiaceae bacterium]